MLGLAQTNITQPPAVIEAHVVTDMETQIARDMDARIARYPHKRAAIVFVTAKSLLKETPQADMSAMAQKIQKTAAAAIKEAKGNFHALGQSLCALAAAMQIPNVNEETKASLGVYLKQAVDNLCARTSAAFVKALLERCDLSAFAPGAPLQKIISPGSYTLQS